MMEDGIVHWAGRPKQVVVDAPQCLIVDRGQLKENTEVLLYGFLEEGKGKEIQQFVLSGDGTLSPMHSSHLIRGWEPAAIKKARMEEISAFVISMPTGQLSWILPLARLMNSKEVDRH